MRQVYQRSFFVEGCVPFDCLEREGAVHRSAFQVYVAQLARQARCNRAFAGASRAIDGNDQFAGFSHMKANDCTRGGWGRSVSERHEIS